VDTNFYNLSLLAINAVLMQKILLTLSVFFIFNISYSQNITGTWQGNLNVQGNSIPIVFHIIKDSSNNLAASFDSPSQHAFNLLCNAVIVKEDSVILMMESINGKYTGKLSADKKQMTGTWHQGGGSLALDVNKTSETVVIKTQNRPQTPKPPYPYHSEDVEYFNADKSLQYGATITYPSTTENNKTKKFPSIILITGSGQQDRDETIFGHKSFAVIADYLTKKGYLVLRVDDRGIGKSTGNFAKSTTADFVKDVEVSLDFLEQQPQVDKNKIGLLGHSEGGMIAPVVADARKEINFIVLLAGPGIPITQLMKEQVEAVAASSGKSPELTKITGQLYSIFTEEINKNEDSTTTHNNIKNKLIVFAQNSDTATRSAMGFNDLTTIDKNITDGIERFTTPWLKYFLAFNPQPYLEKLHCKVLALNGSKDVQVIPESNLAGIKASLKKSKSPKYDVIEIPGLNHLFQTCIKCSPDEYGDLEESFSPKALDIIGNWLDKNVK
jgi:pimeloyl-ACP methyl ester carboxylesterase